MKKTVKKDFKKKKEKERENKEITRILKYRPVDYGCT